MTRKKTIDELRIEREKAEQDLKFRQENLKTSRQRKLSLPAAPVPSISALTELCWSALIRPPCLTRLFKLLVRELS